MILDFPFTMKIGLLSDTHGHLEEAIFTHFASCDEIWHAGDIGTMELLERLEGFKPTHAVYGNIDGGTLRTLPETLLMQREGVRVLMTHIAGKPPRYNPQVLSAIRKEKPNLVICGHSHILQVLPDKPNNLIFMNPGAAGIHGFHRVKTMLRFDLLQGKILNLEAIELGLRGKTGI